MNKDMDFQPQNTKYLWSEAFPEDKAKYSASLDELLAKFNIPSGAICCCDLKCCSLKNLQFSGMGSSKVQVPLGEQYFTQS